MILVLIALILMHLRIGQDTIVTLIPFNISPDYDLSNLWLSFFSILISFFALWVVCATYIFQHRDWRYEKKIEGFEQYIRDIIGGFSVKYKHLSNYESYQAIIKASLSESDLDTRSDHLQIIQMIEDDIQQWANTGMNNNYESFLADLKSKMGSLTQDELMRNEVFKVAEFGTKIFYSNQLYEKCQFGYIEALTYLLEKWGIFKHIFILHTEYNDLEAYNQGNPIAPKHFMLIAKGAGRIQDYRQFSDITDCVEDLIIRVKKDLANAKEITGEQSVKAYQDTLNDLLFFDHFIKGGRLDAISRRIKKS